MVLNASVAHLAATQHVLSELHVLQLSHDRQTTTNPPQFSTCTAQAVLNASVAHMVVTQHVLSKLHALSLSHGSRTTPTSTYIYCTGGTDCFSCTLGTHLAVPSELRQDRDNFPVNPPSRVLTAHAEWLSGVQLRHSVCAVHIEVCGGWWLSGCRGSMAKHWRLKPELSWV